MDSTSVSLLRRLREPDHDAAWERFVELYAPLIFHWGRHQGLGDTDAGELVQEVLAIVVAKLPEFQYDPKRRFRGWLRTVTLNKANDFHRRNAVRPRSGHEETIASAVATEVDLFEEAEYRAFLVGRALELMQSEFRDQTWQACWMHLVDGRKAADVAQELDISVNMVYLAKSRILGRLREELDGLMD
jgi:RNA polymerase sigma-70 factor (ECF subfamily)